MRPVSAALALFVLLGISPSTVLGQSSPPSLTGSVPRLIYLSGVFRPADGQPPAPVEVVTLAIYADAEGGTPLWQETQSLAVDDKGRYALLLGASQADGIPPAVWTTGAQWLGTRFERAGEIEGPRVRLTSVLYALRAADADTLGGQPASAYMLASATSGADRSATGSSPSTGSGSPSTGSTSSSTGIRSTTTRSASSPQQGSSTGNSILPGTPNFLAKYVNSTDVGPALLYDTGTAVGLGTTVPFDQFHVKFSNPFGTATGFAVQNLGNTASSYSGMLFYDQNGALGQFQGFNNVTHEYRINNIAQSGGLFNGSINFMIGSTSRFLVASNGNIGIGTTAPATSLEVSNGLSLNPTGEVDVTTYGNNSLGSVIAGRKARGTAVAPAAVQTGDALAIWGGKGYGTTGFSPVSSGISVLAWENWTDTAQGTIMNFATTPKGTTQPLVRMELDAGGNLAIGTNPPTLPGLEVSNAITGAASGNVWATTFAGSNPGGSAFIGRTARGTAFAPAAVQNGDDLAGFVARGYGATQFGGGGGMHVRASENWTDTAEGTLIDFGTTANGTTAPRTRMTIDSIGNVGIGTATPANALEVTRSSGNVNVVNTAYSGVPGVILQAARGTSAAPASLQVGDALGVVAGNGYGATGFGNGQAAVGMVAAENWTDTAHGTAIGFLTTPLGSTTWAVQMAVLPTGNVGIGTPLDVNGLPTALNKLQVFGDIRVGTSGANGCLMNFAGTGIAGTCASDRRFKENITPFGQVLDRLTDLQPVHYSWRAAEFPDRHFGNARAYGLIAQDVEPVLPELVVTGDDGFKAVDYSALPLLTIQAVKELKAENDLLKQRVAELERLFKQMPAAAAPR